MKTTGTKLSSEERKAVEDLATSQGKTVSAIVRDAVLAYLGLQRVGSEEDVRLSREGKAILKRAANDTQHPHHDFAYGVLYSPRTLGIAYR